MLPTQSDDIGADFTRFLLRKELMLTLLTNFNDKPESFSQWKCSFLGIMRDLCVKPSEEIDLLIKWLGPESSRHAISLRAANTHDPARGLQRIWDRLNEKYGRPEMVEASIKAKLESFPKLGNRDFKKLYELSDILSEIESLKEDKSHQLPLGYFDSSSGVIPIVKKLPYSIQEKWTMKASEYKQRFQVSFPRFWFFCQFVRDISRIKNDPSFNYEQPVERQKPSLQPKTVLTRKTNVTQQSDSDTTPQTRSKCPLHKGSHSLKTDIKEFVYRNFYVDDGVTSLPSVEEATDLLQRTQKALKTEGNLRLHKIASNCPEVMSSFPVEDLAKDLKDLRLGSDALPTQRSLGLLWDLRTDTFTFKVSQHPKPFTRRGILSTVNSLCDPLGFVGPVRIGGKLLLRDLISESKDWDEPLPPHRQAEWERWRNSLNDLEQLHIDRMYTNVPSSDVITKKVHIYSDASEQAIVAVSYMKTTDSNGSKSIGFIVGKLKSPRSMDILCPGWNCAAVLAVEVAEIIFQQLDIQTDDFHFHTDSRVVLGYVHNTSRRFYKYVSNRVERITSFSSPRQWTYVSTGHNPADIATRAFSSVSLISSVWLKGPSHLHQEPTATERSFSFVDPQSDTEIIPVVKTLKTTTTRFERFSVWDKLVSAVCHLKHICRSYDQSLVCKGWHIGPCARDHKLYLEAELHIIRDVQREVFVEEIDCLQHGKALPKGSSIQTLSPVLDENGMLRVGGRIDKADVSYAEKHPLIIPGRHHVATLLVRHYHNKLKHQGRHFTEGIIRSAGLWIVGGKRLISKIIHHCLPCRKLRGNVQQQKMADVPTDRLTPAPPFTYVGVDVFGPWSVVARKTRGSQACAKRWTVIFTCLTTRAIHLELIAEMSSSSFINALRRFVALRRKVAQFRSDRGTNFVGATNELKINTINVEDKPVQEFLRKEGTTWIFNPPPHLSNMGGAWERLIRTTRQILNSLMTQIPSKNLTHEVLSTFLAEVSAIVNSRRITPVSTDRLSPEVLCPSTLLTQKTTQDTPPVDFADEKNLYKAQWKCVQILADTFWKRWRREYLQTL